MLSIQSHLFMIITGDKHWQYYDIVRPILTITCSIQEQLVAAFKKINESAYEMSWYLMPIDVRKQLVSMMAMAQRPVHLQGFVSIRYSHAFMIKVRFDGNKLFFKKQE